MGELKKTPNDHLYNDYHDTIYQDLCKRAMYITSPVSLTAQ